MMRFVLLGAALLAGWVASAAGVSLPPVPPVPPVRVPTLPLLPPPKIPEAPTPPRTTAPAPSVPHPAPTTGGGITSAVRPPAISPQASASSSAPSSASPAKVYRLRFSRDWISRTGPKRRRQTTLRFVLRKPALVEFVVFQIAPRCREVGRFRVRGRAGLNRVRFRGRIGRRVLGPGTYLIKARVADAKLVIVSRPNGAAVKTARGADACTRPVGQATRTGVRASAAKTKAARHRAATRNRSQQKSQPARRHGVLGTRFTKVVNVVKSIPLVLFILLAFAIALLALAALPLRVMPNSRTAAVLAQNRAIFAGAGAIALAATMISYVMT